MPDRKNQGWAAVRGALRALRMPLLVLASLGADPGGASDDVVEIGNEAQLFIDDHLVASTRGLTRRVTPLAKHPGPVIQPDKPWEARSALPISAMYDADERLYRMWYRPGASKFATAYATSRDGIAWDKPALGLAEWNGSRDDNNNLLSLHTGPAWNGIIDDAAREPDPARRYKMLSFNRVENANGLFLYLSSDGLNWTAHADKPALDGVADGHTLLGWDPGIERYVAYVRPAEKPVRTISRVTSTDMYHWSPMETVLEPDEDDPPGTQLYGMSAMKDRGVYIGFLWVYHPNRLMIDTQLAFSRDGIRWQRAGRRHPILSYGLPNQFDSHVLIALQPIRVEDELTIFYLAEDRPHAVVYKNETYPELPEAPPRSRQPWLAERKGYCGLATCLRDRYVALEAFDEFGELATRPFKLSGRELALNADASGGEIQAELLDDAGTPLPGFTLAESHVAGQDALKLAVRWNDRKDVGSLRERTVQLRLRMRNAKLYSLQVLP